MTDMLFAIAVARAGGRLVGFLCIIIAVGSLITFDTGTALFSKTVRLCGLEYLIPVLALCFVCFLAINLMQKHKDNALCVERYFLLGPHAANGVATISLVFTLIGICSGIGIIGQVTSDGSQSLPSLADMSTRFQQAFATTIIGLPLAAFLRYVLSRSALDTEDLE